MTSANLCRWIIDYNEIQIGEQGSYGIVSRGKWKGVDVAVKRIKQKLDERTMLEFRAEVAFLVELDHPNVVLFLGACVQRPNLAIVTDFVKRGSLKSIIEDDNVKVPNRGSSSSPSSTPTNLRSFALLRFVFFSFFFQLPFQQSLRMLRGAALGINYLHSLDPAIIHRDIKPSNLLVDESWNVKVADFGFARIKEENATMTYCDTPAWTAPEIIRGEKYSEKADIYSFGVVMWEMLTRRQPYAGRNFIGVSLDVLQGKRPPIPPDCPSVRLPFTLCCYILGAHHQTLCACNRSTRGS
jgi:serine/threonine protein kinase